MTKVYFKLNSATYRRVRGSTRVHKAYRIIATICKHIVAEEVLAGGGVGIGIEEAANLGIVISGLQIIEPGLYWGLVAIGPFSGLLSHAEKSHVECHFRSEKLQFP